MDIPRNVVITAFVNRLFFLGKSKEENMTENRKNCCCKMKINKVSGIDNLSGKFLKDGAKILAIPIAQICNLSIKLATFPNECKLAKVKPLYKKGTKTDPKNYRPICISVNNHQVIFTHVGEIIGT